MIKKPKKKFIISDKTILALCEICSKWFNSREVVTNEKTRQQQCKDCYVYWQNNEANKSN